VNASHSNGRLFFVWRLLNKENKSMQTKSKIIALVGAGVMMVSMCASMPKASADDTFSQTKAQVSERKKMEHSAKRKEEHELKRKEEHEAKRDEEHDATKKMEHSMKRKEEHSEEKKHEHQMEKHEPITN
jgi:hypothetical protein